MGRYTAMSIAQGGNGFPFFSPSVYKYVSTGKYTDIDVRVEDIADSRLNFAVTKVWKYFQMLFLYFLTCCFVYQSSLFSHHGIASFK